jgi:hypothetical protein
MANISFGYEEDRILIIAIESETEDLPIGEVRKLWAPYALEAKDAEIARREEPWQPSFREASTVIVEAHLSTAYT